MKKNYQTKNGPRATTGEVVLPASVTLAMAELADSVREGLLALAVGAGLQVMATLMAEDVTALCGPKGRHDPDRRAVRHGSEAGSVTLDSCALTRVLAPLWGATTIVMLRPSCLALVSTYP